MLALCTFGLLPSVVIAVVRAGSSSSRRAGRVSPPFRVVQFLAEDERAAAEDHDADASERESDGFCHGVHVRAQLGARCRGWRRERLQERVRERRRQVEVQGEVDREGRRRGCHAGFLNVESD